MKKTIYRRGRVLHVDTPELKEAQALYMELLTPYRPAEPFTGPLGLTIAWAFPHLKSISRKRAVRFCWKDTSPDLDNCEKLLLDVMQKMGFFQNDGQIAYKTTKKIYTPSVPCIVIRISQLAPEDALNPNFFP